MYYQGDVSQGNLAFQKLTLSNLERGAPTYWCGNESFCDILSQSTQAHRGPEPQRLATSLEELPTTYTNQHSCCA